MNDHIPDDPWANLHRRITDYPPKVFDDLDENETESSRRWQILIILSSSALVVAGWSALWLWAGYQLGITECMR